MRLLILPLGLALVAGTASASPLLTRDRAYASCLVNHAQRIGAGTDEKASSVVARARQKCAPYERALDVETGSTRNYGDPAGNWFGTSKDELIERSERVAVDALLKARARLAGTR
nr:hypothetical protein [uncultured Sphingomonas sp.]